MSNAKEPVTTLYALEEEAYKPDLEVLDRYVAFSAEVVRIALLGLAAIGFYLKDLLSTGESVIGAPPVDAPHGAAAAVFTGSIASHTLFGAAALALAIGAAFGLLHRYFATDGLAWHVDALRSARRSTAPNANALKERARNWRYKIAFRCLITSECAVVAGAVLTGAGFLFRFLLPPASPDDILTLSWWVLGVALFAALATWSRFAYRAIRFRRSVVLRDASGVRWTVRELSNAERPDDATLPRLEFVSEPSIRRAIAPTANWRQLTRKQLLGLLRQPDRS